MNPSLYLLTALRLYCDAPDTPQHPTARDHEVALDLQRRGVSLDHLAHAIRLATLRRHLRAPDLQPLEPVQSLNYYRRVLEHLEPAAFDPGYVEYVAWRYRDLLQQLAPNTHGRTAAEKPEGRRL